MDSSEYFTGLIIDTGVISIQGSVDSFLKIRVRNSWQNDVSRSFGTNTNPLIYKLNDYAAKHESERYDSIFNDLLDSIIVFTKLYPNSYKAFSMATSFIVDENRFIPFAKKWYPLISDELKNSTKGKQVAYIVYGFNADSLIGKAFPLIETFNKKKEKTTFKLNTQNVYLIDNWASWCVPCIQKLPSLKKIYSNNKNKGFKILSLSIDENYEAWIKAIKEQQIPWENYSSLNGINSDDTKYFNIRSIPYTILVGKNNKIIKINPTDEEVEQYLKKL